MNVANRLRLAIPLACSALLASGAGAQTHRVEKSEPVTRAVAVYEYLGDLQKPTAARLIPVSLYLGGHFEDAGTYLSQPIPLSLQTDTVYELQSAGTPLGALDLAYAKNFRGNTAEASSPLDDGWFGYGRFIVPKAPKAVAAKSSTKSTGHAYEVQDDGKPHFGSKPDTAEKPSSRRGADVDPADERATKISLPDDDRDPKAPNPERPTLKRSATDTNGGPKQKKQKETASVIGAPPSPNDDPDRPTIRRNTAASTNSDIPPDPSELGSARSVKGEAGTVTADASLADGARPELRRGKTGAGAAMAEPQKVSTAATRPDLKFAVAVSDSKTRPEHDFHYTFASDTERLAATDAMRKLALAVLANPALATDALEFAKTAAAPTQARPHALPAARSTPQTAAARRRAAVHAPTPSSAETTLVDEQFSAFTLSFGAPVTYTYTAHTAPAGGPARYVTVVAQRDADGNLQIGLRTVTDAQHLDRVPRYRLVDAVDAEASNRASLLFEVRGQSTRQFALYRLLGPKPDQVFETGLTR